MTVEACAFYEGGVGYVCGCEREPTGEVLARRWIVGTDGHPEAPVFLAEASAYFALRQVWYRIRDGSFAASLIRVNAGDAAFCRHMCEWCNRGGMNLWSQAAPEILSLCRAINTSLTCPLIFCSAELPSFFRTLVPVSGDTPASVASAVRLRMRH